MVAHLLRLKLILVRNGLRRSTAAIVGMVIGLLYGGFFLVLALVMLVSLRFQADLELVQVVAVLGGAALMLGWAVLPVLLFGVDPTLDPGRFATFAIPERTLAAGLVLAGLVGLPGLATLLLGLGAVVMWSRGPVPLVVALVAVPCAVFTCVLLSRIVTAAASAVLASRRGRDAAGVGAFFAIVVMVPAASLAGRGGEEGDALERAATVVAWTPVGWAWSAPGQAATGHWGLAWLQLGLALALVGALFLVWERLLVSVLVNPRTASARSASGRSRGLGLFARLPGSPLGAIAARAGTYWLRDPRFNFPAIMTVALPAGLAIPGARGSDLALAGMPLASAYLIGWGQHNDVGYDSTAFWLHVSTAVDGVSDRLGRLFPSGVLAAVCVPGYALLGPVLGAPWRLLPATLGVATALALNGFAVSCVASAIKQYAVPGPGESPFSSRPGGAGLTLAVQAVCGSAVAALSAPALVLGALAWAGHEWAAWAALLAGPALGALVLAGGACLGAWLFERRGPELLQDLVAMR